MQRRCLGTLVAFAVLICMSHRAAPEDPSALPEIADLSGGVAVHIGLTEAVAGEQLEPFFVDTNWLVHVLDTDAGRVEALREDLQAKGLYGGVSADIFDGKYLPYVDGLVNLLVISPGAPILATGEVERVLAPRGRALIGREQKDSYSGLPLEEVGKGWYAYVKPVPAETSEWPHYLNGPGNNAVADDAVVGPPKHFQWVSAPEWTRNHHRLNSLSAAVTAAGRLFYIVDEATAANMQVPGKWVLVARDAHNGKQLWKRPLASWAWHQLRFRSGPPQVSRLLIADGGHVYAPLGLNEPVTRLDARTGETLSAYPETAGAEEMVLINGVLLVLTGAPVAEQANKHPQFKDRFAFPNQKALLAVDTETGTVLWRWAGGDMLPRPETLAADAERAYMQVADGVVAIALENGEQVWTYGDVARKARHQLTFGKYTLVVEDGVVLSNLDGTVAALDGGSGEKLWEHAAAKHGFHEPLDIFVIDGLVWLGTHRPDSVAPPALEDFSKGIDLHTGEIVRENTVMAELQTAGHHHRCYRERATTRYIMAGKRGIEMMDLEGEDHFRANWVRGSCQFGFLPANGLIYAPPHSCGCYMESKLRGFNALAASRGVVDDGERVPAGATRLEKGPAYSWSASAGTGGETTGSSADWPVFRGDSQRSAVSTTAVPAELSEIWRTALGGRLTQPVAAGGKVVVASVDEHTVYALEEASGAVAWTFTCGGRVDSPPSIHKGRVLFGAADGRVYCLRLSDGALAWRFTCAPMDLRMMAYDQLESLWPVHGSVLVLDGKVYCAAGRLTWLDDGIQLAALDPATGAVLHSRRYRTRHPEFEEGKEQANPDQDQRYDQNVTDYKTFAQPDHSDAFSMAGGAISDVLVSDGRDVFLHQARFSPGLEHRAKMARHLFSTSSLLDGAENHRSHWMLGTGDFSRVPVAYSWIVNRANPRWKECALAVPYGVMLACGEESVWGVHRNGKADGTYTLFRRANQPLAGNGEGLPDFRELPEDADPYPYVWQKSFPERPRALVKAGAHLFVACTPTESPEDDPHAAYEGRMGGSVGVFRAGSGEQLRRHKLDSPAVWDGMAAANKRLYVAREDGTLVCLG